MLKYKPSKELIDYCFNALEKYNLGLRTQGKTNGKHKHQFAGLICENIVRKLLGIEYYDGHKGFDGGWDVMYRNLKTDVKSSIYYDNPVNLYQHHVPLMQLKYDSEAYVFCGYDPRQNTVTVCGWIDKPTFIMQSTTLNKGTYVEEPTGKSYRARYSSMYVTQDQLLEFSI